MLPTFVIGLREGLEAALIVGIIAAFLRQRGRLDLIRRVWLGVAIAIALCLALGIALKVLSGELPQRQQEGLETVIGLIAVAIVTYMIVWMRRHSRELKKQLEGAAESAVAAGGMALVAMAFLAVLREGFETAVFLVAAFNQTASPVASGSGAILGIVLAAGLGYGIYRGGVRINLSKFFRVTGAVLALVAAGLMVSAAHTAHEAGWLNIGQGRTFDLSWLVRPGSVQSSLFTGMLGWQPRPVTIEVVVWLAYLIPVGLYVTWPPGRRVPLRAIALISAIAALAAGAVSVVLVALAPQLTPVPAVQRLSAVPAVDGVLASSVGGPGGDERTAITAERDGSRWRIVVGSGVTATTVTAPTTGSQILDGRRADVVEIGSAASVPAGLPGVLSLTQAAAANGGRLPLGTNSATEPDPVAVSYSADRTVTLWVDEQTGRVLNAAMTVRVTATGAFTRGPSALAEPVLVQTTAPTAADTAAAAAAARQAADRADTRTTLRTTAGVLGALALVGALAAAGFGLAARRRRRSAAVPAPVVAASAARTVEAKPDPASLGTPS